MGSWYKSGGFSITMCWCLRSQCSHLMRWVYVLPLGKQVSKPQLLSTHPKKQLILILLLMLKHGWDCVWWGWCSHMHTGCRGMSSEYECWDGCTSIHILYLCHMRGVGMSMYDETITRLYVRSYLFHMHVRATTRRLYVRPLRKSSRHSSLLQAAHKNFHPHHHHTHPPSKMCFLSSFQSFPFPSADASRIFLFSNCNHNLPWNCVQSSLKCFTTLNCFLFLHNMDHIIAALFLLNQVEHSHTLTFQTTSPFCCCYMSFQHKCKLYTCWLWLILYLIKQFWLISQSVSQLVGEIVILLAWRYLLVDWLILYWLTFSLILWWAIDELMNQSCTENFLACQLIIAVQFFCYHRNNW